MKARSVPFRVGSRESGLDARFARLVREAGGEAPPLRVPSDWGWPDRLVILPHCPVAFVELKAGHVGPAGLSRHQREKHARLVALGQRVEVVSSLAEAEALIESILRGRS